MSTGSDEAVAGDRLQDALIQFTVCIGEALDICSYGLTIGESYVPFESDPDEECSDDEVACEQAWVRVANVGVAEQSDSFAMAECGGVMEMSIEVGVLRCIEVAEGGEAPTATQTMLAALQALTDMQTIYCAAMNCEVWDSITSGQWVPEGPLGGQHGGTWMFTVRI